jgi:hypothetical protein
LSLIPARFPARLCRVVDQVGRSPRRQRPSEWHFVAFWPTPEWGLKSAPASAYWAAVGHSAWESAPPTRPITLIDRPVVLPPTGRSFLVLGRDGPMGRHARPLRRCILARWCPARPRNKPPTSRRAIAEYPFARLLGAHLSDTWNSKQFGLTRVSNGNSWCRYSGVRIPDWARISMWLKQPGKLQLPAAVGATAAG